MNAFPRNSSRTITQATSVPKKPLISTTRSDTTRVSLMAATASGAVTAVLKDSQPPLAVTHASAASGSSTIRLR